MNYQSFLEAKAPIPAELGAEVGVGRYVRPT